MAEAAKGNVGLAFAMVCAAGACTSLGAGVAFCVNLEVSRAPRACALRAAQPGAAALRCVDALRQAGAGCGAAAARARAGAVRPRACPQTVASGVAGGPARRCPPACAQGCCAAAHDVERGLWCACGPCSEQALSRGVSGAVVWCHVLRLDDRDLCEVARGLQVRLLLGAPGFTLLRTVCAIVMLGAVSRAVR